MGRAAYHSGADVYLGAAEAANLVGAWRQLGSDFTISTPPRAREQEWHPRHHRHRHHRPWGENAGPFVPPAPVYNPPYVPPAPLPAPPPWASPAGGVTVRDHRSSGYDATRAARAAEWNRAHPGIPFVGVEALMGAVEQIAAQQASGPTPRAWLRDMPPPDMANRQVLPMNTGTTPVPQNSTAQITSRPQRVAFRPERVFIGGGGIDTITGDALTAADWIVNDITIGNRSQFAQSGALPGDMFANIAIDSFVTFETAQTAMDVVMIVTYQGPIEGGKPFYGSIIGTAAV